MGKTVRIEPTGIAFIPDVPAVEMDVPADRVGDYVNWNPPAFRIKPPGAGTGTEATEPTEQVGSSDSGS